MRKYVGILFVLLSVQLQASTFYHVRDFGSKGDGKTIDSPSINKAIEAAAKVGGGTIIFPAGTYASYSVRLKSNICLQLEDGAIFWAAFPKNGIGYDAAKSIAPASN